MTRIFISYDRDDRPFTRQLADRLRRVYGHVWFDENLYGGEDWWNEIRNQIADCDVFMYLLTEESARSKYCQAEFSEASRLSKEILPVRIKPIQTIPDNLRQIQYVDMSDGAITVENFTELNAALKQIFDKVAHSRHQSQVAPLKESTRRAARLWTLGSAALVVAALLLIVLTTTPTPPFQGEIAYVTGATSSGVVAVLQGGLPGTIGNLLGRNPRLVTEGGSGASAVAWSPDSQWIAFSSERGGNADIYVMRASGTDVQRLTTADSVERHPVWSRDGRIAYTSVGADGRSDLFVMEVDLSDPANPLVGEPQRITDDPADYDFPTWSPDGRQIAFASNRDGNWEIYIVGADGDDLRNLTNNDADDQWPAWSPDGRQIAFESNRTPRLGPGSLPGQRQTEMQVESSSVNRDIYVTFVDESSTFQITRSPGDDRQPAWSPDGRQLVFVSDRDGDNDLYLVDVAERVKVTLLTDNTEDDRYPVWHS